MFSELMSRDRVLVAFPYLLGALAAIVVFLWGFEFVVERHSWATRTLSSITHASSGLLRGGFLGLLGGGIVGAGIVYIVGGIGIAAMGTAFAAVGLPVIAAGAIAGMVFGGAVGAGLSFWQYVNAPEDFALNAPMLALLIAGCALIFGAVKIATARSLRRLR